MSRAGWWRSTAVAAAAAATAALATAAVATAALASITSVALAVPAAASARAAGSEPATPVQDRYAQPGPLGVVHVLLEDPSGAVPFELYRPAQLGPEGQRAPLATWGNGSFAHPAEYDPLLRQLASWGFVVVASTDDQVGTGEAQLAAVRRAAALDADPADPLHGRIDLHRVAAIGHSQGAGGSVRAATAPDSPIGAVLTFDLPHPIFALPPDTKGYDPSQLRVPVLFLSGADDQLISGTATNRAFLRSVPGPAGMALLVGSDHNGVQHGRAPYAGYTVAWLRYVLLGDPVAAAAFTGPHPELLTAPGWQDQALQLLDPPPAPAPAAAPTAAAPDPTDPTGSGPADVTDRSQIPGQNAVGSPAGADDGRPELPRTGGAGPAGWPAGPAAVLALALALALRRTAQIART